MLMGFRWNCSGTALEVGLTSSIGGAFAVDVKVSADIVMAAVSTIGDGRACLSKLGVKHTLQFEVMLHLGLNLFQLCDAVVLNTSFLLSLLPKFKDFLVLTGK